MAVCGAIPNKVASKKYEKGILSSGEQILMNQLGSIGLILRKSKK
jgi:hypothetical protein